MNDYVFAVEIKDKREEILFSQLQKDGFICVKLGQEIYFNDKKKVYLTSISKAPSCEQIKKFEDNSIIFLRNADAKEQAFLTQKNITIFDYMHDESFVYKNAKLTAECALSYIIANSNAAFEDLKILICGAGRIGKSLLHYLKMLGATVYVASDNISEIAYSLAFADGAFKLDSIQQNIANYNVIVNTIPKIIFKGELLSLLKTHCFLLDLASMPGGVEVDKAKQLKTNYMHALGVPGKLAPITAAKILKESVLLRLSEL